MSLVERALKKMMENRGQTGELQPPAPLGRLVEASGPAAPDEAPPAAPARVLRVDRAALRDKGLLPPEHHERRMATEYRQIKRPLLANALGRGVPRMANGQLIMMASALPGDGKTFTSVNLALSLALERDTSVVLVDADVAKPHISNVFGVRDAPGLLDALRDNAADVESMILGTDIPRLNLLPVGQQTESATELLASTRMQQIAARLGGRDPNRIVLFDSPPLLLTSESRALADMVGQIVLVVRAGVTPQKAVLDALELLGENRSVGLVLNESSERGPGAYYPYYGERSAAEREAALSSPVT